MKTYLNAEPRGILTLILVAMVLVIILMVIGSAKSLDQIVWGG